MTRSVTVTESIHVAAPCERVFDATQDWTRRAEWDRTILEVEIVERADAAAHRGPLVRVRAQGGLEALFRYKRFERPRGTTLAMEVLCSSWFEGGGGAWSYEAADGGTRWTQTNALTLRPGLVRALFTPLVRWTLRASTRRALRRAKELVERAG